MKNVIAISRASRWLSYLTAFILVLVPFHELLVVWLGSNTGHLDLLRIWKELLITLMVPAVLWLVWSSKELRIWLYNSWIVRLYLLYFLLHAVLGLWALNSHQVNASALIYGLIINLRLVGFFIVCTVIVAYDKFLKDNWPKLVFWPAALVIVFGLLQRLALPLDFLRHFGYGSGTIPAYQTIDNDVNYQRIQSTLRGANPLGAYLVLIITAAVSYLKLDWRKTVFIAAALVALFFSYSRSAWAGLFLGAICLAYIASKRINRKIMLTIAAIILVLGGGLYSIRNYQAVQDTFLHTSSSSSSVESSNNERAASMKKGLRDILHQPLGRGPGTAGPASQRNSGHPARIAENYYLQLGQEIGVLGLLIFIAMNIAVAAELWRHRHDVLAKILLASLAGISFINLLSHAWADDTLGLLWWGLAGIALAPVILNSKNKHYESIKPKA